MCSWNSFSLSFSLSQSQKAPHISAFLALPWARSWKSSEISLPVPNPTKIRSLNWWAMCSNSIRSFKRNGKRGEVLKTKNNLEENIICMCMIRFCCFEVLVNHRPGGACMWAIKHGYIFKIRWEISFWILSVPSNDLWGISCAQPSPCVFCHCLYILCC